MRKPSLLGAVALGAVAGLVAAIAGDLALLAGAGLVGLSVLGSGPD